MNYVTLNAMEAAASFPNVKGPIYSAQQFQNGDAIINQGKGAYSVIIGGEFIACCRTPGNAVRALNRAIREPAEVVATTHTGDMFAAQAAQCALCDRRVRELEEDGLTTSDAQGVALAEHAAAVRT